MFFDLIAVTLTAYISMILYCASLGYVLGSQLELEYKEVSQRVDSGKLDKRTYVIQMVQFFIGKCKWILLLFPALFSSTLFFSGEPLMFMYSYTSTMLLHMLVASLSKKIKIKSLK